MKNKSVVVFGGCGYVGSVLVKQLLENNNSVLVVDNLWRQSDVLLGLMDNSLLTFQYGSVTDYKVCEKAISNKDYIINLAGLVGAPICSKYPHISYDITVGGTKNILKARHAVDKKIPLFFASTGSVYGRIKDGLCTEDSPTIPLSEYGQHKLEAEQLVRECENVLTYRFATCMGVSPNMRVNLLINDLVYQAVKNKVLVIFEPDFRRTFIHINSFARSIIWGLDHLEFLTDNVYNMGAQELNCTKRDVAEKIKAKTGCYVHYADFGSDPDGRDYEVDYSKITSLGFKTTETLDQTIDELIKVIPLIDISNRRYN